MNMGGVGRTERVGIVGQFRRLGAGRNTSLVLGFWGLGLLKLRVGRNLHSVRDTERERETDTESQGVNYLVTGF